MVKTVDEVDQAAYVGMDGSFSGLDHYTTAAVLEKRLTLALCITHVYFLVKHLDTKPCSSLLSSCFPVDTDSITPGSCRACHRENKAEVHYFYEFAVRLMHQNMSVH